VTPGSSGATKRAYETEQSLALGLLMHRFRTRTELERPHRIVVASDDRSFCRFDIRWQFSPLADDHCHVDFTLDCETRSLFLMPIVQLLVLPMATSMVAAFRGARARAGWRCGMPGDAPGGVTPRGGHRICCCGVPTADRV
jgi:ribosome-associated toxin RatA of RatAB toxin-antitoxin module